MTDLKNIKSEDFEIPSSKIESILSKQESVEQILETGSFIKDELRFKIDIDSMDSFVHNFKDRVIGTDPPVNFGHDRSGEAAGWIKDVFLDPTKTKLFALIRWTASGLEALRGRMWRYLSAEFTNQFLDGSTGRRFGPTLAGAALTNVPFLRHMPPVVGLSSNELAIELKQASSKSNKGDHKMANDDTISLSDHNAAIKHLNAQIEKLTDEKTELSVLAGEVKGLKSENETLKQTVIKMTTEIETKKKELAFDELLAKGKACAAQKEAFMSGDMNKFIELAQPINLEGVGHSGDGHQDQIVKFEDLPKDEQEFYNRNLSISVSKEDYVKYRDIPVPKSLDDKN